MEIPDILKKLADIADTVSHFEPKAAHIREKVDALASNERWSRTSRDDGAIGYDGSCPLGRPVASSTGAQPR